MHLWYIQKFLQRIMPHSLKFLHTSSINLVSQLYWLFVIFFIVSSLNSMHESKCIQLLYFCFNFCIYIVCTSILLTSMCWCLARIQACLFLFKLVYSRNWITLNQTNFSKKHYWVSINFHFSVTQRQFYIELVKNPRMIFDYIIQ